MSLFFVDLRLRLVDQHVHFRAGFVQSAPGEVVLQTGKECRRFFPSELLLFLFLNGLVEDLHCTFSLGWVLHLFSQEWQR